jgi:hypothetical protein
MLETREVEINPETSKNEILNSSSNTNSTINIINNPNEVLTIKPKVPISKFETLITNAYKNLVGFSEGVSIQENKEKKSKKELKIQLEEAEKLKVNKCENELRKALEEIESTQIIYLNKNILDKTSRIYKRNKINLSLVIGEIYIQLMNKKNIFNKLNQKDSLNKNIIISFINEVININSLLKHTYLCIKYDNALFHFLENIIKEIAFDSEQLNEINVVLKEHKSKKDQKKLNTKTSLDFLDSINEAFNKENSLYGQYKVVLDNAEDIINLINNANITDENEIKNFIKLGVLLVKLFFGKNCILLSDKANNEENKDDKKVEIKKLFDGFEDNRNGNINVILGEKFFVDYDNDLEPMRENLCKVIIKFIEKFKNISNLLELQYIQFVLLKRIYFYYFEKFEKEISPLFTQILINLCLFKDNEKINPVVQFVNELLNSKDEKDNNFKELLKQKIEEAKNNSVFDFKPKNKLIGNLEKIQNEVIYIEEPNLNLGFFTDVEIECGDSLNIYVELSKPFGFIDFALDVKNYDINFNITNLSEGKVIYQHKKLKSDKALKLNLFFTKPGIFKFEFDNTYSWVRNKNISYKVSTFYPQHPSIIENRVSISKYQELINNSKKLAGKQVEDDNKLEIVQDNLAYQYNINDIKQNIELLNSMIISFQVKILSIYLDKEKEEGEGNEKKYFYVEKESLEKAELTEENLMKYIDENKNKNKMGITIVNLFIITGDSYEVIINRDLSLKRVLGFEPKIENEKKNSILFFVQYYDQAQLLYYLCNKTEDQQDTLLINYTKFGGYQVCVYSNGEIITEVEDLKNINKNEFPENNIELISGYIKKLAKEHKIKILVTDSIDTEEKNITAEKMSENMQKSLGIKAEEEGNYQIIKLNKDYNKDVERFNHLLNLIE